MGKLLEIVSLRLQSLLYRTIAKGNESSKNIAIAGKMISDVRGFGKVYAAATKEPNDTSNGIDCQIIVEIDYS